ncbi:MAG: BamA/TamA family outer membrane protein, partial [Candidatus Zixiibacteriota bacterium]
FNVSFTEPYLFGRPTLLGTDLFAMKRRWFTDYTENRQGAAIRLGRRLRWPDNYFRIYASYRLERNKFDDFSQYFERANSYANTYDSLFITIDTVPNPGNPDIIDTSFARVNTTIIGTSHPGSLLRYGERWNSASRFSLTITRDSRNLPEFATQGSLVSYTISQTGGPLGGFWNYTKHSISAAKFFPLFWRFAIAAKVQFGAITSPYASDSTILISDRFIPGGTAYDGIVRGYEDGSLTPDTIVTHSDTTFGYTENTKTGETTDSIRVDPPFRIRVRGNYMLVSNIELQFPIAEQSIYGLLFFDAGNSWRSFEHIKPFRYLYRGWGFGIRVLVPGIGTIGGDLARPLDVPPNGDGMGWKFHFQIGTTFR